MPRSFRRKFAQKCFRRNVFAETFREKVLGRFLVLEPYFEFGPAWGLGLTGCGLGAVAWGEYFRRIFAQNIFGEAFSQKFAEMFSAGFSFWNHILNWACLGVGADWLGAGGCGLGAGVQIFPNA